MCGLLGAFHHHRLNIQVNLQEHLDLLSHRGPDAAHYQELTSHGQTYAKMGVRRLAITSPTDGEQPVFDPTKRWLVSLNGEIYNYKSLRREAIGNGFPPRNPSDSAVVAALLSFLPMKQVLQRLRGMFAMAIIDQQQQELWLIRDRMGVKPLYWHQTSNQTIIWSSELRALKSFSKRNISQTAVQHFMLFEYIPAPWSIYTDIHKLQAGHLLHVSQQGVQHKQWWQPPQLNPQKDRDVGPWKKAFRYALEDATRLRAQADVPICSLLSGGIDSATIAAFAKPYSDALRAFSVSINEAGFDEKTAAERTAQHLQIPLTVAKFDQQKFVQFYHKMQDHMDEPLADSSLLPTFYLMSTVKNHGIKCALSGDGADESLAGYPTYIAQQLAPWLKPARSLLSQFVNRLPVQHNGVSNEYMAKRFLQCLEQNWWRRHQLWMGAWLPEELNAEESVWDISHFWATQTKEKGLLGAMYLDQRMYLSECVLTKVDRASMAYGVEVRSPFLDHRLVELMASLPLNTKTSKLRNKRILRDITRKHLPPATRNRRKKGFGSPVGAWLLGDLQHLLHELPKSLEQWIPKRQMQQVIDDHLQKKTDNRRRLWTALCLQGWLQKHHM